MKKAANCFDRFKKLLCCAKATQTNHMNLFLVAGNFTHQFIGCPFFRADILWRSDK